MAWYDYVPGGRFVADNLSGSEGYETAAKGAKEASSMAKLFAQDQWARQMQGLGMAQQSLQPYRTLYDQIYGTNTPAPPMPAAAQARLPSEVMGSVSAAGRQAGSGIKGIFNGQPPGGTPMTASPPMQRTAVNPNSAPQSLGSMFSNRPQRPR
jgi:hypothetical protein